MFLVINKIPEGRSVLSRNVEIEEERAALVPPIRNLICRAEIDRIGARISVHLFYQGEMSLDCSRCLKEFFFPLSGNFYISLKNYSAQKNNPHEEDEESDYFFNDMTEELDIRSAIFDEILLSVPMKPLCNEACPGIAFASKDNVSIQTDNSSDPRWNELKKINRCGWSQISSEKNDN